MERAITRSESRWASWLIASAVGSALLLHLFRLSAFLGVSGDDVYFIDVARHLLSGGLASDLFGDLLRFNRFALNYPPLHAGLLAMSFALFGESYVVAKMVSVLCYAAVLLLCVGFVRVRAGKGPAVFSAWLLAFDPLFFLYSGSNRPEMTSAFLFTAAVLSYQRAEAKETHSAHAVSGLLAGLACLSSLNNLGLLLAYALHQLSAKRLFRNAKLVFCYGAGAAAVGLPYYAWLLLSPERLEVFLGQLAFNSSLHQGMSMVAIGRALLNPLADLYLMLFRYGSCYPIVFFAVMAYLLRRRKRLSYLAWVLGVSFAMMVINERAERFLLLTMPLVYAIAAWLVPLRLDAPSEPLVPTRTRRRHPGQPSLVEIVGTALAAERVARWKSATRRRVVGQALVAAAAGLIGLNVAAVGWRTLRQPLVPVNTAYYREVLETYTEPGARIAADLVFYLSATEGRRILSLSCFTWDRWREVYSFGEIDRALRPDYVLLTAAKKMWLDEPSLGATEFREWLRTQFGLVRTIPAYRHGTLWLYRRLAYAIH